MTCVRCEIARAKIIAIGMAGLRKSARQIADELAGRYGMVYHLDGKKVMRDTPTGAVQIIEVRR